MKTEQLSTEDWKEFIAEHKKQLAEKRANLTTLVYKFCVQYSVNVEVKTVYHLRLSRQGYKTVDVFPTSSKVHVIKVGNAKGYKKVDLLEFLTNHFTK